VSWPRSTGASHESSGENLAVTATGSFGAAPFAAMRALVTGASGFVGHHLVAHLREAGDEVGALEHAAPRPVDVTDGVAVRDAVSAFAPDAVYHLAAASHVGDSWEAPGRVFRVNAEGTLHVLRACTEAGVDRVLVVGSADQYGKVDEGDLPLREDAPQRPLTPYGASKAAGDLLALQAHLGAGLGAIRVRAFNHTGPRQAPEFLVPGLAQRIAVAERGGTNRVVVGSLDPVRDVADVRDVVRAYRLLMEWGTPGETYNVCTGVGVSVGDIARHMLDLSPHTLELVVDPALLRPVEVPRLIGDPTKLRAATGWAPTIPLDRTLADVLDEARSRSGVTYGQ
jgi:GDP-4-dehydro-6-deoxy-D-mannose reductase